MKNLRSQLIAGIAGGLVVLLFFVGVVFFYGDVLLSDTSKRTSVPLTEKKKHSIIPVNRKEVIDMPLEISFADVVNESINAVVHIRAEESKENMNKRLKEKRGPFDLWPMDDLLNRRRKGIGSGVIVSDNGFIITNYHVIKDGDNIVVTLKNGNRYRAEKRGADPKADLALLKIDATDLDKINYADSDLAEVGDWVLAIGNPFDELTSTVTAGIISAKGRNLNMKNGSTYLESYIQTDAVINPGNSGGALLDIRGRLLGINTAIYTPTGVYAGYSFAIPSNQVRKIMNVMLEEGIVKRASLGISITKNDSLLKEEYNLKTDHGWVILEISHGSSAQYAGLHPFDVILTVNGKKLVNKEQLLNIMGKKRIGDTITITVQRKGVTNEIDIYLRK